MQVSSLFRGFSVVAVCASLAACSGSGGGGGDGGTGSSDQLGANDGDTTGGIDAPISGTARYDGFMTLNLPTSEGRAPFTGSLGLDVDFDASAAQVTGEANNFLSPDDDMLSGRLMVTDGEIDSSAERPADYTFEAGISGTLRGPQFRNMVITGTLIGDFNGDTAEVLSGSSFGDVIGPTGADIFNGSFSAAAN